MKCFKKKIDGNYTRMLYVVLNKSWKQYFVKQQFYIQIPLISESIQVKQAIHTGNC